MTSSQLDQPDPHGRQNSLDTTTNWAVVATGATLSIAFSQPEIHHAVIILNTLLVMWFLFIRFQNHCLRQ
jgi:uncharacterized membrane protein